MFLNIDQSGVNYVVHDSLSRAVREYLKASSTEEYVRLQGVAGECWEKMVSQTSSLWDHLEARHHYMEAVMYDKAAAIVENTTEYLHRWGYTKLALRLNQETVETATKDSSKGIAFHHLGLTYYLQGDYDKALEMYEQSLKTFRDLTDQLGIANSLHQIGIIYQDHNNTCLGRSIRNATP